MKYVSTRGEGTCYSASEAVIRGLADDGGLFVPESFPKLSVPLESLKGCGYREIAYEVMKLFFDDYTEEELKGCINAAYDQKFDTEEIAAVCEHGGQFFLELFHGPTIAFKDMALSILPHLLTVALKKNGIKEKVVIMTATSGDTGKAALSAFADVENTKIIVFYPKGGVSHIQELQMVTQKGANTKVVGVSGNFDDCQTGVKKMFSDPALKDLLAENGYRFSSANSINIGRLIPQVVYYVYSYVKMMESGVLHGPLNFTVPTGNFGNILAAFYAKKIGVPIGKLVCASNENKVLFDFFKSGTYDRNRDFILTTSPSMDILISSNLERLIYHSVGDDADKNAKLMKELAEKGVYSVDESSRKFMDDFVGIYATEDQVKETIRNIYEDCGYVIDTHTAVAAFADKENKKNDRGVSVVVSTASPYKFVGSVLNAIAPDRVGDDDFDMADRLCELSGVPIPPAVTSIRNAKVLHDSVCSPSEMEKTVTSWLAIS
ncbi:MAG: threonine synthase [Lachnospiraceae bacterium]|nr:threonine synthase [Lachnospiraceae bacterium]